MFSYYSIPIQIAIAKTKIGINLVVEYQECCQKPTLPRYCLMQC